MNSPGELGTEEQSWSSPLSDFRAHHTATGIRGDTVSSANGAVPEGRVSAPRGRNGALFSPRPHTELKAPKTGEPGLKANALETPFGGQLRGLGLGRDFSAGTREAQATTARTDEWGHARLKSSHPAKEPPRTALSRPAAEGTGWGEALADPAGERGPRFRADWELVQLRSRKTYTKRKPATTDLNTGRGLEQAFLPRRHAHGQRHTKRRSTSLAVRDARWNPQRDGACVREEGGCAPPPNTGAGEDVDRGAPLCPAGGSVGQCSPRGLARRVLRTAEPEQPRDPGAPRRACSHRK